MLRKLRSSCLEGRSLLFRQILMRGGWGRAATISTLGQQVVAEHLAQPDLHNLSGRGVRQFVEDYDVVWQHPARKALGEKCEQVIALRPAVSPRRHDQQRSLGPARMRDSDYCGFGDVAMGNGGVFEIDRADPLAAGFDDVLTPIHDLQIAVR